MKYIRTENGIYELIEETDKYYICRFDDKGTVTFVAKEQHEAYVGMYAITEADTIEELCDEFVAIHPTNKNANYITGAPLKNLYETEYKKFKRIIYGAIWTSKGLIYVAEMDIDGKLVLI